MDSSLVFILAAALFAVRDARLLARRPRLAYSYIPLVLAAAAGCGALAERLSAAEAQSMLADRRLWGVAMAVHALLCGLAVRRVRGGKPADWISALPTPIQGIALTGAARFGLVHLDGAAGPVVGLILGGGYALLVILLRTRIRAPRAGSGGLRFAATTHLSAFLLIPASAVFGSAVHTQPIDWRASAAVLASVAALVGASFGWHRFKHRSSSPSR